MQIVVNKRSENGKSGQIHPKMNILEIPIYVVWKFVIFDLKMNLRVIIYLSNLNSLNISVI